MATYSIKAVKYCEQNVPGPEMFFMSRWDEWLVADFFFFILRRDDGAVFLIDPGVRDVDEIQPMTVAGVGERGRFRMEMATQNIPLLLRKEGIDPEDVKAVLLTHLHYDHCSNAKLFPNAQFLVSRKGFYLTIDPPVAGMTPDILFPRDIFAYFVAEARDRVLLLDDEAPEVLPGIGGFYVGGHTMCSQAFTVQTPQGLAVFPGDTIFYYENLERDHPIGAAVDQIQCRKAMNRVRNMDALVVPPHDPALLQKYPGGVVVP